MASRQVTSQQAFALLRKASNESNRNLRDVADRVVLTGSLTFGVGRPQPRSGVPARTRGPTGKPPTWTPTARHRLRATLDEIW